MELFLDTETSGLPNLKKSPGDASQPHVVQLALYLRDERGRKISSCDVLIRPDGWTVDKEASDVHGITTERAVEFGLPLLAVSRIFLHFAAKANKLIAFNAPFDIFLLKSCAYRLPEADSKRMLDFLAKEVECCMTLVTPILNLPPTEKMKKAGYNKPKNPNLGEAYEYFFKRKLEKAHDAMVDVLAMVEVYDEAKKING